MHRSSCCMMSALHDLIEWKDYSRLQEPIAVAINVRDGRFICDTDMIWLDSDKLAVFLVCFIDAQISLSLPCLEQQPQVREFGEERSRDIADSGVGSKVRYEEEKNNCDGNRVWREDEVGDRHCWYV